MRHVNLEINRCDSASHLNTVHGAVLELVCE